MKVKKINMEALHINTNQKNSSIISFSLFFAWLLSFPFEGQVLYSLAEEAGINAMPLISMAIFVHFLGLFSSGFIIKKQPVAKLVMLTSTIVCIAASLMFLVSHSVLWHIAIIAMAFFAGLFVGSWGFHFKIYSEPAQRLKTAADVLIYSNIIMIFINVVTVYTFALIGLSLSIICLLLSLLITLRLEGSPDDKDFRAINPGMIQDKSALIKPLLFLLVFIFVITINSGFMYQVINPAFSHYELLSSYYWAIPYIAALVIIRNLPGELNRAYILYVAMAMIGFSFIAFMYLDRSVLSYLIIDTLMLGACGVCDIFWWSILGHLLDYTDNPSRVLGLGLSMNVLGVLVGGIIGNLLLPAANSCLIISVIALVIIFTVLIMWLPLNTELTRLLQNHVFLLKFAGMVQSEQECAVANLKKNKHLTDKETEVVNLLLRGYTYKAAAESLFISENTMKYHVKNIYQKLQIKSKMELIKMFTEENK